MSRPRNAAATSSSSRPHTNSSSASAAQQPSTSTGNGSGSGRGRDGSSRGLPPPVSLRDGWASGFTASVLIEVKLSISDTDDQFLQPLAAAIELLLVQKGSPGFAGPDASVWVLLTDLQIWRFFHVQMHGSAFYLQRGPTIHAKFIQEGLGGAHPEAKVVQVRRLYVCRATLRNMLMNWSYMDA